MRRSLTLVLIAAVVIVLIGIVGGVRISIEPVKKVQAQSGTLDCLYILCEPSDSAMRAYERAACSQEASAYRASFIRPLLDGDDCPPDLPYCTTTEHWGCFGVELK